MIEDKRVLAPMMQGAFLEKINTVWHMKAMWLYGVIVTLHMLEHILQAFQVYLLQMPRDRKSVV